MFLVPCIESAPEVNDEIDENLPKTPVRPAQKVTRTELNKLIKGKPRPKPPRMVENFPIDPKSPRDYAGRAFKPPKMNTGWSRQARIFK